MKKIKLNTLYPTEVINEYLIDPSIMNNFFINTNQKRKVIFYDYKKPTLETKFIKEISSNLLLENKCNHNSDKWYIDIIRYNLNNDTKRIKSGLAWHCENDNYPNVITVLFYLRIDEGIIDGNLRYKDRYNKKHILKVNSGTTIIMDGNVPHKPQDPYGSGIRDLIIVSFEKNRL